MESGLRTGLRLAVLAALLVPSALVAQSAPPALVLATAQEEAAAVDWLKASGHAFDPGAYGAAELAPLVARLAPARIVGIGEATHGGHQDQAFKAELIKALVRAGQIDVLVLEANRAAGAAFDGYVRGGTGDPARLLRGSAFFRIWKDDEFAGLLLWLRGWNLQSERQVRVIGIDNQDGGRDAAMALGFVSRFDSTAARHLRGGLGSLIPAGGAEPGRFLDWYLQAPKADVGKAAAASGELRAWFAAAPARARSDAGFDAARWAAETAWQAFQVFEFERADADKARADASYYGRRDRFMAANAIGMLGARERAAIWAHDSHVMEDLPQSARDMGFATLGTLLRERLGDSYATLGFTWSGGAFHASRLASAQDMAQASQGRTLDVLRLPNNRPGELGHLFDQTGAQALWVDLATRPTGALLDAWAARPYWRGWAGWGVVPAEWQKFDPAAGDVPLPATMGHDVIVWFRTISPSRLWPIPAK